MADFSKTITNGLHVFGSKPTNKWGTFTLGQLWAYTNVDLMVTQYFTIIIDDSLSISESVLRTVDYSRLIGSNIYVTTRPIDQYLIDTHGFYTVFTGNVTNADNQLITGYSSAVSPSSVYNESIATTTTYVSV